MAECVSERRHAKLMPWKISPRSMNRLRVSDSLTCLSRSAVSECDQFGTQRPLLSIVPLRPTTVRSGSRKEIGYRHRRLAHAIRDMMVVPRSFAETLPDQFPRIGVMSRQLCDCGENPITLWVQSGPRLSDRNERMPLGICTFRLERVSLVEPQEDILVRTPSGQDAQKVISIEPAASQTIGVVVQQAHDGLLHGVLGRRVLHDVQSEASPFRLEECKDRPILAALL